MVLLPPALGTEALPGGVAVVATSLLAQEFRLVHVNSSAFRLEAHLLPADHGTNEKVSRRIHDHPVTKSTCEHGRVRDLQAVWEERREGGKRGKEERAWGREKFNTANSQTYHIPFPAQSTKNTLELDGLRPKPKTRNYRTPGRKHRGNPPETGLGDAFLAKTPKAKQTGQTVSKTSG